MRNNTSFLVLSASLLLGACGNSYQVTDSVPPTVTETSADATAYVSGLSGYNSDTSSSIDSAEPLPLPAGTLAVDDTAEPAPVN